MNRLTDIRLHAQQLVAPQFDDPAELIRWMGMVQAQEYSSAKWAVALRLRTPAAAPVEEALREGRILRMHIMRPTWHFIAAEDVRWMLHLSARRIRAANASFAKGNGCGLDEGDHLRCSRLLERILGGQPPHAAADRRGAGTSRNGRRRTAVESSDDARRNGRRGLQRCRQGGKTYLCAVGGTGAAGGRSAGRGGVGPAGAPLFPQPFSGDVRRFRLVVGVARRAGPPRCRGRWTGSCCANRSAGGSICCTRVGRPAERRRRTRTCCRRSTST